MFVNCSEYNYIYENIGYVFFLHNQMSVKWMFKWTLGLCLSFDNPGDRLSENSEYVNPEMSEILVPLHGNFELRPLGVAMGNALSMTRV